MPFLLTLALLSGCIGFVLSLWLLSVSLTIQTPTHILFSLSIPPLLSSSLSFFCAIAWFVGRIKRTQLSAASRRPS